jgi:hypothetical protein
MPGPGLGSGTHQPGWTDGTDERSSRLQGWTARVDERSIRSNTKGRMKRWTYKDTLITR